MSAIPDSGAPGAFLRVTPFEVAFAGAPVETEILPAIAADVESHGTDSLRLEAFGMLPAVGEAVRAFVPPEAPPEALEQYRALLYHGFNYWMSGRSTYLVQSAAARFLVEAQPRMENWEFAAPRPSLYIQLPYNLFWGSVSPDETPEPIDGFFLTAAPDTDPTGGSFVRLDVLLVLGLRRDRAGFSVIPFDTEAGRGIAAVWAEGGSRDGGADFENVLPGGEMSGLYSVLTVGEVLKLLGRILWYVDRFPEDVSEEITPVAADEPGGRAPGPSRIPYRVITLGQGGQ